MGSRQLPYRRVVLFPSLSFSFSVYSMIPWKLCIYFAYILLIFPVSTFRMVKLGGKDCKYKGEKICNGAVTKEYLKINKVRVCNNGKLQILPRATVGEGFPLVGRDTGHGKDCIWYGTVFCDGDVIEDLHRWWFLMKCSKSKFTVHSRSYSEVTNDKRFSN